MKITSAIFFLLTTLTSWGQASKGAYISDKRTGCKAWTDYPSAALSVSWSGSCQDKIASGEGTLTWFYEGKEVARYTGIVKKGLPDGKGKYTWSNGYVQEGNYFQGQFLNLDSIYLQRLEKVELPDTDKTNIYINDGDAQSLFYYALMPKGTIRGALILLSGSSETANSVFTNTKALSQQASDQGLVVIVPSINNNLWLGTSELNFLNAAFESAVNKYRLPNDHIVIGGFSLGGLYALRYTEMANDSRYKTVIHPSAVFAADPPVDLARLYNIFQREADRNTSEAATAECMRYIKNMETAFGGDPSGHPEKYRIHSVFSRDEKDGGNLRYLKTIPVRIYSDPDIDWQMKNRNGDYYDMGALDQTSLINLLNRSGNSEAKFINALGKGYTLDGTRNPHSWSIIDAGECVHWMMQWIR